MQLLNLGYLLLVDIVPVFMEQQTYPLDALHIYLIERMNNSIRTTVQIVSQVVFPRMLLPTSDQLN